MKRREILVAAGGIVAGSLLGPLAFAADPKTKKTVEETPNPHQKLIDSTSVCIARGQECIRHCQEVLASGDTSMGACLKTALEMVAACELTQKYAAYRSVNLAKAAALAAEACKACEEACRKHEHHHKTCKDCAEACASCAKECLKVAA
jgi:Cys-rich four helix bundle protein (predicted Tat secretion target)